VFAVIYQRNKDHPFSLDSQGCKLRSGSVLSNTVYRNSPMYAHFRDSCPGAVSHNIRGALSDWSTQGDARKPQRRSNSTPLTTTRRPDKYHHVAPVSGVVPQVKATPGIGSRPGTNMALAAQNESCSSPMRPRPSSVFMRRVGRAGAVAEQQLRNQLNVSHTKAGLTKHVTSHSTLFAHGLGTLPPRHDILGVNHGARGVPVLPKLKINARERMLGFDNPARGL